MEKLALLAAIVLFAGSVMAAGRDRQVVHPGYGVVEYVSTIRPEASASAGASAPRAARPPRHLVRVRLDDGRVEMLTVRALEVRKGQRVLVTNAGDVIPD